MPNNYSEKYRRHIPKLRFKVQNWREYDAGLRGRESLTMWVTDDAIAHWQATPRLTPDGQPWFESLWGRRMVPGEAGVKARRTWRKLHLATDAATGMIVAATLNENDRGDSSQVERRCCMDADTKFLWRYPCNNAVTDSTIEDNRHD